MPGLSSSKLHTLVQNPNETVCDLTVQRQTFEGQLDVALRDRLVAGINRPELQRKLLSQKEPTGRL